MITGNFFPKDFKGQLQYNDGSVICDNMEYVSITQMRCNSKPGERTAMGTQFHSETGHTTKCVLCTYETDTSITPVVTSITKGAYSGSSLPLNILGSNFPTSGVTARVWIE